MLKQLTENDVTFHVECDPEDAPITTNYPGTGDIEEDKKHEAQLKENLKNNEWFWCRIKVIAKWRQFLGWTGSGCMSFDSKDHFLHSKDYLAMKKLALLDLNLEIANVYDQLCALVM